MVDEILHLTVKGREGSIFDSDVNSITSYNEVGEFDILPNHANFISLIKQKIVILDTKNEAKEITFDNALMRVSNNLVEVYIGVEGVLNLYNSATD